MREGQGCANASRPRPVARNLIEAFDDELIEHIARDTNALSPQSGATSIPFSTIPSM